MGVDLGPGARGCVRICATLFARFICAFGLARTCLRIRRIRPGTVGRTRPAPLIGRIRPRPARRSGPDSHRPARRDAATLVRVGRTGRAWHSGSARRVCKLLGHHIATQPVAWRRLRLAPPRASRCCDPCLRRPDRQGLAALAFRLGPESLQAPWSPHSLSWHPAGGASDVAHRQARSAGACEGPSHRTRQPGPQSSSEGGEDPATGWRAGEGRWGRTGGGAGRGTSEGRGT